MQQWTYVEFCRMIKKNGFYYMRTNGSHSIFINKEGRHMSVPKKLNCILANRLIKENNLNIKIK